MINTLVGLLIALTIGTIALMMMETAPIRPVVQSLIATIEPGQDPTELLIRQTDIPLQPTWRNIVIHAVPPEDAQVADRCHFIIAPGTDGGAIQTRATRLWKRQGYGRHIVGPNDSFNENSIAICLVGSASGSDGPWSGQQLRDLLSLVRSLQFQFQISRPHVYLHRDLDTRSRSPGPAFPAHPFYTSLLRTSR